MLFECPRDLMMTPTRVVLGRLGAIFGPSWGRHAHTQGWHKKFASHTEG